MPTLSPPVPRRECDHGVVSTPPTDAPGKIAGSTADKHRKRLLSYSTKNMIYSVLAVVALTFVWWSFSYQPDESMRRPAEVEPAADFAAREVDWPVWSPVGLPEAWRPTTVSFGTVEGVPDWRQGWVSPATEYVALQQALDPPGAWSESVLAGLEEQEPVSLDGPLGEQEWTVWTGVNDNDEREVALVLAPAPEQAATTIVHGTADVAEMRTFVQALEVIEPTATR